MLAEQIQQELIQGTPEWLALRKTKITATDAAVIMRASHWKTPTQLYYEKTTETCPTYVNDRMQRGLDLEPIARSLFTIKTGIDVEPLVVIKDWAMASLDGISTMGDCIVEIKCPGPKDHAAAVSGKVPDHYYPQLQHQMYVCDVDKAYYFSFDGTDGVIVEVARNNEYIAKMVIEETKFYDCLVKKTTPAQEDYIERHDSLWEQCATRWKTIKETMTLLEKEEEEIRKQLIFLSGEANTKGAGISLCQVKRKGTVDYSKIPELKNIDLEKYRKPEISSWRIS